MPLIDTKTNIRITPEKEAVLKDRLGKAIEVFPGKTEYWLMLNFTDQCRMWVRGYRNFPIAMVEVKLWEEETSGAYPAIREEAYIEVTSYGGDTTGYQIPFTVHYTGVKEKGSFDVATKEFTAQ